MNLTGEGTGADRSRSTSSSGPVADRRLELLPHDPLLAPAHLRRRRDRRRRGSSSPAPCRGCVSTTLAGARSSTAERHQLRPCPRSSTSPPSPTRREEHDQQHDLDATLVEVPSTPATPTSGQGVRQAVLRRRDEPLVLLAINPERLDRAVVEEVPTRTRRCPAACRSTPTRWSGDPARRPRRAIGRASFGGSSSTRCSTTCCATLVLIGAVPARCSAGRPTTMTDPARRWTSPRDASASALHGVATGWLPGAPFSVTARAAVAVAVHDPTLALPAASARPANPTLCPGRPRAASPHRPSARAKIPSATSERVGFRYPSTSVPPVHHVAARGGVGWPRRPTVEPPQFQAEVSTYTACRLTGTTEESAPSNRAPRPAQVRRQSPAGPAAGWPVR